MIKSAPDQSLTQIAVIIHIDIFDTTNIKDCHLFLKSTNICRWIRFPSLCALAPSMPTTPLLWLRNPSSRVEVICHATFTKDIVCSAQSSRLWKQASSCYNGCRCCWKQSRSWTWLRQGHQLLSRSDRCIAIDSFHHRNAWTVNVSLRTHALNEGIEIFLQNLLTPCHKFLICSRQGLDSCTASA